MKIGLFIKYEVVPQNFEKEMIDKIISHGHTFDNENPDYVFVVFQGDEKKGRESFNSAYEKNPVWSELKAVKNKNVIFLPKDLFNYKPNARWAEAYEIVAESIKK